MLELKNISKSYGTQLILDNISLQVKEAEMVSILGPSGSGKSTLLQIIGLLMKPDSGQIYLDGVSYQDLTEKDLLWAKYPEDKEILEVGVRGVCIGNYFGWDPNAQTKIIEEKYGWRGSDREFQRTYRKMSNLGDRYENGAHDLLKFIKFGYGRGSDHASKDIRTGYMTREEGIEMVRKYDHVVSDDLDYWLKYVEMSEEEFWSTADTFRDPRVWWIKNGEWWKDNIWGGSSAYGRVHLTDEQMQKYLREGS